MVVGKEVAMCAKTDIGDQNQTCITARQRESEGPAFDSSHLV